MTNTEKLASPIRLFVFHRADGFYPLELPEATVSDNAIANPGTLRVEDAQTGEVVWHNSYPEGLSVEHRENQKIPPPK